VQARLRGVSFKPGDLFSPSGVGRNCCRIVVAHYEEDVLVEAIETLCDLFHSMQLKKLELDSERIAYHAGLLGKRDCDDFPSSTFCPENSIEIDVGSAKQLRARA